MQFRDDGEVRPLCTLIIAIYTTANCTIHALVTLLIINIIRRMTWRRWKGENGKGENGKRGTKVQGWKWWERKSREIKNLKRLLMSQYLNGLQSMTVTAQTRPQQRVRSKQLSFVVNLIVCQWNVQWCDSWSELGKTAHEQGLYKNMGNV